MARRTHAFTIQDLERIIEELINIRRMYKSCTVWDLCKVQEAFNNIFRELEGIRKEKIGTEEKYGYRMEEDEYEDVFRDFDFGPIDKYKTQIKMDIMKEWKKREKMLDGVELERPDSVLGFRNEDIEEEEDAENIILYTDSEEEDVEEEEDIVELNMQDIDCAQILNDTACGFEDMNSDIDISEEEEEEDGESTAVNINDSSEEDVQINNVEMNPENDISEIPVESINVSYTPVKSTIVSDTPFENNISGDTVSGDTVSGDNISENNNLEIPVERIQTPDTSALESPTADTPGYEEYMNLLKYFKEKYQNLI